MMSQGFRVLTLLIDKKGLADIYVDEYEPYEKRDNLSFSIHDMQHLERFFEDAFFYQQVGFLYAFKSNIFKEMNEGYAMFETHSNIEAFKHDVNHVISDMNACVIHMISFFKAKWLASYNKSIANGENPDKTAESFNQVFCNFCIDNLLLGFIQLDSVCDKSTIKFINYTPSENDSPINFSGADLQQSLSSLCDKSQFLPRHAEIIIQIFDYIGKERIESLL